VVKMRLADSAANLQKSAWVWDLCARGGLCLPQTPYAAFFRSRASLGCELVAIRSQLTFYKESIRQKKQTRPRFTPAFRLLWVLCPWFGGGGDLSQT
jgi:hypothetical protein